MLSSVRVRPELKQMIDNMLNQISPSNIYKQTKTSNRNWATKTELRATQPIPNRATQPIPNRNRRNRATEQPKPSNRNQSKLNPNPKFQPNPIRTQSIPNPTQSQSNPNPIQTQLKANPFQPKPNPTLPLTRRFGRRDAQDQCCCSGHTILASPPYRNKPSEDAWWEL